MQQIIDFFLGLFHVDQWPARWFCGEWSEFHGWLYILSDLSIWLAYFLIPLLIIWFVQKKPEMPFISFFWLFSAFIVLCGATHLMDAIIFWWPAYRLSALIKFFTAIISFITVFALIKDMPKLLMLELPKNQDEKRKRILAEEKVNQLEKELQAMTQVLSKMKLATGNNPIDPNS